MGYVARDETGIYHYTLQLNRQSAEGAAIGDRGPKRLKRQKSTVKVTASVLWNALGIIFIDYLGKGTQNR